MIDFYTKGYKVTWNETGNREDKERTIVITELGEELSKADRTFVTLLSWKEGETWLYKKVETVDPRTFERWNETGSVVDLREAQAKDILTGIKELIQIIEETKYTPK